MTPATGPVVLESKLYPGVGAAQVISRANSRPPAEFVDGRRRLALVCAPAGYGKSTLLSGWHQALTESGVHCAWLTLDAEDNDPARLMRHLIAAVQRAEPGLGASALRELGSDIAGGWQAALQSLAGELCDGDERVRRMLVFLDDVHVLTEVEALRVLDWLIQYAPECSRFALGTREMGRLRLGRRRAHGQLLDIGPDTLRFSLDETRSFLEARLGKAVAEPDLSALLSKTEGWPAALELAGMALRSGADRVTLIERFSGRDVNVVDYFAEVVLDRIDMRTRDFVLRVAQFDRISAELALAVTDESEAESLLLGLREANLFLIPLDRDGRWYRFHHLAAEFLRSRFERELGAARATLVTGARWLHAHGHTEDAINCAIRAREWDLAAQWVSEAVDELVYRHGYHHTILQWMKSLPAAAVDRHPEIRIHYMFALTFSPYQDEVLAQSHQLQLLQQRLLAQGAEHAATVERIQCEVELVQVIGLALKDQGQAAMEAAERWLLRWPKAPLLRRGTAANILCFGYKTQGEIDKGLAKTQDTREWLCKAEGWYSLAWNDFIAAVLLLKRGDYLAAREQALRALELLDRRLDGLPGHAAMLHAVLAVVAYEFDELAAARGHLDRCLPRLEDTGQADALIVACLTAAKLDRLEHGEAAGLARLRHGQELGRRRGLLRLSVSLAAEECSWHSREGRFEEARRIAERHGFAGPDDPAAEGLAAEKAAIVASRFLVQRTPASLIAPLDRAIARCVDKGMDRRRVELLMVKGIALRHAGEPRLAAGVAAEALAIAVSRNYLRVFLDEAGEMLHLFELLDVSALRGSAEGALVRRLLQAMREARPAEQKGRGAGAVMVEELSKREIAILKRLESDLSNKEIAEAIFISEGTLKWHLHNIYGKLAVKNRSGAVAKARTLALI